MRGDTLHARELSIKGTATAVPIPNMNPYSLNRHLDFTVEHVSAEYRLNGGPWSHCNPTDGRFDSSTEEFSFTASSLDPWFVNRVEVRAVTTGGNVTPDGLIGVFEFFVAPPDLEDSYLKVRSSSPTSSPVSIGFVPFDASEPMGALIPVEIAVYDAVGRKVRAVKTGEFASGKFYSTEWDGKDSNGEQTPAGVYLVGIDCGGRKRAQKIILVP